MEPGTAGWKAQTNPLNYGGHYDNTFFISLFFLPCNNHVQGL